MGSKSATGCVPPIRNNRSSCWARSGDEEIIKGLSLGADDYVAKPFSITQLVLRVKAVLRRTRVVNQAQQHIRLGDYCDVDCLNLSARSGAQTIGFTRREVEILQYLSANTGARSRAKSCSTKFGATRKIWIWRRGPSIYISPS